MQLYLRRSPASKFTQSAAGKKHRLRIRAVLLLAALEHRINQQQQLAGLRRQLVERAHQHIGSDAVGRFDVRKRGLDVA